MTNKEISTTWEMNLLPYVKIVESGVRNTKARKKSFKNWIEILVERDNIENTKDVLYVGNEI